MNPITMCVLVASRMLHTNFFPFIINPLPPSLILPLLWQQGNSGLQLLLCLGNKIISDQIKNKICRYHLKWLQASKVTFIGLIYLGEQTKTRFTCWLVWLIMSTCNSLKLNQQRKHWLTTGFLAVCLLALRPFSFSWSLRANSASLVLCVSFRKKIFINCFLQSIECFWNGTTVAMLVYQTSPKGVQLFS